MAEILGNVKLSTSKIREEMGNPFTFCTFEGRYSFGIAARTGRVRNGLPEFALVTAPQGCREGFTGGFKSILARKEGIGFNRLAARPRAVDKYMGKIFGKNKKVAILVAPPTKTVKGVTSAKRVEFHEIALENSVEVLNALEAEYGWPRSVCYKVEGYTHSRYNNQGTQQTKMKSYVVEVSRKWVRTPHLVSLVSLILRSGKSFARISKGQLTRIEIDGGEKALKVLSKSYSRGNKTDLDRLVKLSKCLPAMMSQYKKVFGSVSTEMTFFPRQKDPKGSKYNHDVGGLEGLDYLMNRNRNGGVSSNTLRERIQKYKVLAALDN